MQMCNFTESLKSFSNKKYVKKNKTNTKRMVPSVLFLKHISKEIHCIKSNYNKGMLCIKDIIYNRYINYNRFNGFKNNYSRSPGYIGDPFLQLNVMRFSP